jgi:hypothetical protein
VTVRFGDPRQPSNQTVFAPPRRSLFSPETMKQASPSGERGRLALHQRLSRKFRQRLLGRRVVVKNRLRALLRGNGITAVKGLWTGKGLAWLASQALGDLDALRREMMLEELAELGAPVKRVEVVLERIAAKHPGVALLRTIPGVAVRTAVEAEHFRDHRHHDAVGAAVVQPTDLALQRALVDRLVRPRRPCGRTSWTST